MPSRTRIIPRLASRAAQPRVRRVHQRYSAVSVVCYARVGEDEERAPLLNLSVHGLALVLSRWLAPGTTVAVRLCHENMLFCWTGAVVLTHSRGLAGGLCCAGGPFVELLPAAALHMLLR
jgi:hypothetical protein